MMRRTIHFSGHVQGVGFRWTTRAIANHHAVAGYVKNLRDGRVELVVEGELFAIDALIGDIRQSMAGHIDQVEIGEAEPNGEFGEPAPGALEIRH